MESLNDALEQVRQAADLKRQLEVRLDLILRAAVRTARAQGALYTEIGVVGGFSSQTAANLEKPPYPDRRNVHEAPGDHRELGSRRGPHRRR
ncbi:hypothetical protein [Kitasatospora sp. HPMI-4]|uniref:hypothetical protein n=1 Tax=Kitasatospora sp. HPMI-4 TaxID=3448443 RepID=UPI003F197F0C